jgi:diacylglycerol kinase
VTLIDNERTKLIANALDRASTACLCAGAVAAIIYGASGTAMSSWTLVLSA